MLKSHLEGRCFLQRLIQVGVPRLAEAVWPLDVYQQHLCITKYGTPVPGDLGLTVHQRIGCT